MSDLAPSRNCQVLSQCLIDVRYTLLRLRLSKSILIQAKRMTNGRHITFDATVLTAWDDSDGQRCRLDLFDISKRLECQTLKRVQGCTGELPSQTVLCSDNYIDLPYPVCVHLSGFPFYSRRGTNADSDPHDSQVIQSSDLLCITSEIAFATTLDACTDGCNSSYLSRKPCVNDTPSTRFGS